MVATCSSENVPRFITKLAKFLPTVGKYPLNVDILFSPANQDAIPPSLGISSAACAIALIALAAHFTVVTCDSPNVPKFAENCDIWVPRIGSCELKSVSDDPPVNQEVKLSSKFAPVRVRMTEVRDFTPSIAEALMVCAPAINGKAFVINMDSSVPSCANEDPPLKKDATPAMRSAAVNARTAPARTPTPVRTEESTFLAPSMNG